MDYDYQQEKRDVLNLSKLLGIAGFICNIYDTKTDSGVCCRTVWKIQAFSL